MDVLNETTVLSEHNLGEFENKAFVTLFHTGNAAETIQISSWSRFQVNSAYPVITIPIKG